MNYILLLNQFVAFLDNLNSLNTVTGMLPSHPCYTNGHP
jgi:hypothetical protein